MRLIVLAVGSILTNGSNEPSLCVHSCYSVAHLVFLANDSVNVVALIGKTTGAINVERRVRVIIALALLLISLIVLVRLIPDTAGM